MNQFHLAPWRHYKAVILVAAAAILWWLHVRATTNGMHLGRFSMIYCSAWFFILFADGTSGSVIPFSLRSYYFMLGLGLLLYCVILAQALFV